MKLTTEKITSQVESAMRHYGENFAPFGEIDGVVDMFDQAWGSTSCGFGGIGGQAMTTATVLVVWDSGDAVVYICGHFAYRIEEVTRQFQDHVRGRRIKGAADKSIREYGKKVTTKC